jgi:hypothetical protein
MRTTLTIDDDVAVQLKRLRRERNASLKEVVNDTLRQGLQATDAPAKPRKPFRMKTFQSGGFLVPIDNIAETLALIEDEKFK